MALHPGFPESPHQISDPSVRWFPADEELRDFATFLENCPDVISYAKNYLAVNFKLDYVKSDGDIANYHPDFIVRLADGSVIIAETKGREDTDVAPKMRRLAQWCDDVNKIQTDASFDFVYVDEDSFRTYNPLTFQQLLEGFTEYKTRRDC